MGQFHHSKKTHSEGKEKRKNKFTIGKTNKNLEDDFVYTQKHKNFCNSFCNILDERFAEEGLSEILDTEEIARLKIPPTIPAHLEFTPTNVGGQESDEDKRARIRAQALADKSYASKETAHLEGLKKLKQKFNRATVLVLKHVDAQINLDLHQFLKSDPIKKLEPEARYNSLREHIGDLTFLSTSRRSSKETTLDGGSICRTSITSSDRWNKPCNATPTAQSSTDLHQQLYILLGHHQHLHPHSSKLTSKRAKQRKNSAMHSFHTADQH